MRQTNIPWELIIAKFKQEISVEENEKLMHWATNPECQAILEDLNTLWQKIQEKSKDYTPDKEYYWRELSARMNIAKQTEKVIPRKTISLHRLYRYAAVACIVLMTSIGIAYHWGTNAGQKPITEQVYTCMNGKSKVFLPDGTAVWLHGNTTLAYGNDFQDHDRMVRISGEAYFEVIRDEEKPFIVQTDGMRVVVHGTKFNVDAPENAPECKVSLIEGSVSLETSLDNLFLKPGEIVTYNKKSCQLDIESGDVTFERSWANDKLYLSNKSLGVVCRYLSKWYNVKINVDNDLKDKYMYTFTLRNEPLEEIIRLMSRINPISYSFDEDNVLTITKKK
ncbi:FecR family protein [uncultured Phocaeicola sp.]|uniref:FecR family protein n=1 Tax=uncultured Phocaeicola sp. TaxID=990718 RepID=UPI001434E673|nr:FecR family protein [uncultured Phocaeicola sp.]GFH99274.1 hypothetical protein IMSAGC004_01677 [Bacteroidaceae bacterium]